MNILDRINTPDDVKKLSIDELNKLADEIRPLIINKVNTIGGHLGPNLGVVELTIAMHYVFNSPKDKFIFDVSHQCYTHKILTGRKEGYTDKDKYLKYSGFTNPEESEHDLFVVGHTSTSVSLATGVAKARDLKNDNYNVVAIIGDGSLSGGEAYEGLNNAAILDSNIIIVVNDNEMSIAENQGGLYQNLELLRNTNGKAECNFFKSLGFDYYYLKDGNNISELINMFQKLKDINHPVILHISTLKGKGLQIAEDNKETFHWMPPHTIDNFGKPVQKTDTYESVTLDYLEEKIRKDSSVVLINAATPGACGISKDYRDSLGKQYIDPGIAEEHAIAYSSALAKMGAKPVYTVLSSFSQRTYDQLSQDLGLNNSPATIILYWGGITNADMTHLCSFDIPLISNIPNLVYLAPTCKEEYLSMLEWSVEQTKYPVIIRMPAGKLIETGKQYSYDYSILNKFEITEKGSDVAIIGVGNFYWLGKKLKDKLKKENNINATLINPRYLTGIDKETLNHLKDTHKVIVTLENGQLNGGYGEKIASYMGNSGVRILNYGADKEFPDRVPMDILLKKYRLTTDLITEDILKLL